MINFRVKTFVIISVIVLIILAAAMAVLVLMKQKPVTTEPETTAPIDVIDQNNFPLTVGEEPTVIPNGAVSKPLSSEDILKNAAKQTAKIFIERYGSYSTDAQGQNIKEVENLVTEDLYKEISPRIGNSASDIFIGVTTRALTLVLSEYADNQAMVEINARRETTKGDVTEVKNQKVKVWLASINNGWLVEKFEWQ